MKNLYSQEQIDDIKKYVKENGYASGYGEPIIHSTTTFLLIIVVLCLIHACDPKKQTSFFIGLIILLGVLFLRLFMIFHDLCHRSFFPTDEREKGYDGLNVTFAKTIEFLCLFSAEYWGPGHASHHKAHGNMSEYDITRTVLTSSQYENLSPFLKMVYKVFRSPVPFFVLSPFYIFWINRFVQREWVYLMKYVLFLFILFKVGSWKLMGGFIFAQYIAAVIGMMLFHLQHQVNPGYWCAFDKTDSLSKANAELIGASVQRIPWWFEYFTNGIEYHNIHHLDPGVPCYKTKVVYYGLLDLGLIHDVKLGYWEELMGLGNTLFNEKTQKYE